MASRSPKQDPLSVWLLFLYGALDSHPSFPSHVVSGRRFLTAAAAGDPLVSPGAVLDVAGCAVCASAAPSSWRVGVVLVVAGIV